MAIGYRIRQARKAAKMSLRNLAKEVSVSAMAISKYERDDITPSSDILLELASALDVKVEYFFRPKSVQVSKPVYRCQSSMGVKDEAAVMARIEKDIEKYLEVESLFPEEQSSIDFEFKISIVEDAEKAADELRMHWMLGIDPIENITELFEDNGVKISLVDGVDGFDACTFKANDNPVIAIRNDIPGDRQRFNLAHELGHIVLRIENKDIEEKAAYRFAGAFLVPAVSMIQGIGEERSKLSLHELYYLKLKYGMSMQAWIYRANNLGIISNNLKSELFEEFSKKGWRREEPGSQIEAEVPRRFERLVYRALSEGYISRSRAEELLEVPVGGAVPEVLSDVEQSFVNIGN